ncbi:MAG: hypothetical protein KA484_08355 [Rhodocyclaceae bacterium]|nr:hypothetical protein [Rhodocyclaceae bacterium]
MNLRATFVVIAIVSVLASPLAAAIGLGGSIGSPVLLQSLHIEIPLLLSAEESPPKLDCIRITPASEGTDTQFFPKNAKLALDLSTSPRIILTSAQTVREPFYEFRIALGCNGEISRDYLVLTRLAEPKDSLEPSTNPSVGTAATFSAPANNSAIPSVGTQPGSKSVPSAAPAVSQSRIGGGERTLTLKRDTTLNQLARGRYPNNQDTRDEYRRLMSLANPAYFSNATPVGSVPLPAGTVLTIPSNLPPPERASPNSASTPVAAPVNQTNSKIDIVAKPLTKTGTPNSAAQDRLVIGGEAGSKPTRPMSAKEATATIERLELMLLAQATEEREVTEKLRSLEALFSDTKVQLQFLEAKSKQQAADQRQLQAKFDAQPEPRAFGVLELLALIVVGGAVGAMLLTMHHRQLLRREANANSLAAARQQTNIQPHEIFTPTDAVQSDAPEEFILPISHSAAPPATSFGKKRRTDLRSAFTASTSGRSTSPATSPAALHRTANKVMPEQESPTPAVAATAHDVETTPAATATPVPDILAPVKRAAVIDDGIAFSLPATFTTPAATRNTDSTAESTALPAINFALDLESTPRVSGVVTSLLDVDIVRKIAASEIPAPLHQVGDPATEGTEVVFSLAPRTHAEIEAAMAIEREIAAKPQATVTEAAPSESAEDPAVELANIMISMGMGDHAEQTLIDYILEDPKRDLGPWLKTLEIYRKSGRRAEFEELAISLRKNLNVAPDAWDAAATAIRPTLEGFPRVSETVQRLWPSPETSDYLASLLGDNRDGSRAGFPQAVAEEILWLMRMLKVYRELE